MIYFRLCNFPPLKSRYFGLACILTKIGSFYFLLLNSLFGCSVKPLTIMQIKNISKTKEKMKEREGDRKGKT